MAIREDLCKKIMKMFPSYPDPHDPNLWEVFKTKEYINGSEEERRKIRNSSSLASYEWENNNQISWLRKYFFPRISEETLQGKTLLDLGSYTGGRLIAWSKRYKLSKGFGIDINPIFRTASEEFAKSINISNVEFMTGEVERLPYESNSFDFIISTDVFEHVKDLEVVLSECYRVLKKGGTLCVAFPQYLQPLEAHIGMVTNAVALQWFFSSKTIASAYNKILEERGEDSYWYKPEAFPLRNWEKLFELNGTSIKDFKGLIKKQNWRSKNFKVKPIFTDGRKSDWLIFKILSKLIAPLAYLPFLNELFLGRINCILIK